MVIGWALCCVMLIVLSTATLPDPYYCINNSTGHYIKVDASGKPAKPCNTHASEEGGKYAMLMCLAALGYVIADVAADGLTVEYAQREPHDRRGTLQTTVYMVRTLGSVGSVALVAFCMNGKQYNGTFEWTLTYNQICLVLAVPAAVMVPVSWFLVTDIKVQVKAANQQLVVEQVGGGTKNPVSIAGATVASATKDDDDAKEVQTFSNYWKLTWELLCSQVLVVQGHVIPKH